MLGTLLAKLQGLFSNRLVVSSLIPLVIFALAWTLLLASVDARFQGAITWLLKEDATLGQTAATAVVLSFVLSVVAFVFSTGNTLLREIMEGSFWPARLANAFRARQHEILQQLDDRLTRLRRERWQLEDQNFDEQLRQARSVHPKLGVCSYSSATPAAARLTKLKHQRSRGEPVEKEHIVDAFQGLERELSRSLLRKGDAASERLDEDQVAFSGIARYAIDWRRREEIRLQNERQLKFGVAGAYVALGPTSMANIAESMRAYADSRYGIAFDVVWPRLQKILQGDDKFYEVLQDAKTTVDFFVSMFWLAMAYVAGALVYLALESHTLVLYLGMAIAGAAVVVLCYRLTVINYGAFAELVRSGLDLYRIKLLEALQMPVPKGSSEERDLWEALNRRLSYGEKFELPYEPPKAP